MAASNVKLTIAFIDQSLNDEQKNEQVQKLLPQINELFKELGEGELAKKAPDPNAPEEAKRVGTGFLTGLLMAEVKLENFQKLYDFLRNRLANKSIKLTVKAPDGREISVEANRPQEFDYAWHKAQDFLNNQ